MFHAAPPFVWWSYLPLIGLIVAPTLWVVYEWQRLSRNLDDPALPDRLLAAHTHWLTGTVTVWIVAGVIWSWTAVFFLPAVVAFFLAGRYDFRRLFFGERCSVGTYPGFVLRYFLALSGHALALIAAPVLPTLPTDPVHQRLVLAACVALLTLWNRYSLQMMLRLLMASPLDDPPLADALQRVHAKTTLPPIQLCRIGPPGFVWANAFAIAGVRGRHVAFSRTLLERCTTEELAAIHAHELAHHEYFTDARLRTYERLGYVQVLLVIPASLLMLRFREVSTLLALIWPLVTFAFVYARLTKIHANELESDRRGAELCGDPEALISALAKLHAIARLPKRWESNAHKHPSLARRIQALRASAASGDRAPDIAPLVIPCVDAGAFVIIDDTGIRWLSGVPAGTAPDPRELTLHASTSRRWTYADLRHLTIASPSARQPSAWRLDERSGERTTIPIAPDALIAAHAALDVADRHLEPPSVTGGSDRVMAALLVLLALAAGPAWSVLLVAGVSAPGPGARGSSRAVSRR